MKNIIKQQLRLVAIVSVFLLSNSLDATILFVDNGASSAVDRYDATTGAYIDQFITGVPQVGGLTYGDGILYVDNGAYSAVDRYDATTGLYIDQFITGVPQVGGLAFFGSVSVPEPSSLLLMGIGLAGLGFVRRRKRA